VAGSSYLKAMQMRKQLEEKAKEAIKKRQQTEELLESAKDRLAPAKSSDVDVSKAEDFFTRANASMADKDYDAALSHAQQGVAELDKAYSDVVMTIAEATSKLSDLLKEQGVNIDEIDKIFRSADSKLGSGKPEEGLKLAKEGWEAAEKAVHERLSSQFSSAQSLIMVAKKQGEDIAAAEDLLSRARAGLESQDYATALNLTQECLDLVRGSLDSEVAEDLDTAKTLMQTAKELGADVEKAEELIARTEEDISAFNFERALNSATLAKGESEKALVRGLSDSGDDCAREIASAQEIDADTKVAADHLSRSRHALKNGNYEEAVAALKSAREDLRNSQFQRVLGTISLSRSKFLTATKMGADLGEAMNYLNKARDALKEARFKEALEFAQLGDDAVDALVRDYQDSEESLKHLSQSIADAMQLGIETGVASDFYQQAQQALEAKELNKVAILVHKGLSEVESSLYKYAMEHFEICELIVSTGDRIGAKMDEARQHMIDSSKAMREKHFMDASTLADQASAFAESSIRDHVAGFLVTVELALSQAEIVDSEAPKDLLLQAKASFDKNAYDSAYDLASQAFSVVDMDSSRKAREILNSAEVEISLAQTMDCDISGILDALRQANAAFARKEYPTVVKLAQDMKANARTLQYGAAERVFSNAKVLAVEAKKIGIDITDIRETLKSAKVSFDAEQYKKAYELSETVVKSATRMIELRKKAYDNITQAAALVAEAKKNKADVEPVMSVLLDAKTSFEHFDYVRAAELAEKAKDETRSLMALYTAANKLIIVRDNIRLLEGLNGEKAESVLQQTENVKTMLKAKDYDLALSVLDRVDKEVNDKLANRVSGLISEAEAGIEDAVEIGIKVDSAIALVQKGRNYMVAHAFKEAIDSVQSAKKDVEGIREMSQRAARLVKEAHERVGECESMHADASEARSMLEKAMSSIKSSEYAQAIEFGEKAVESAKGSIMNYVSDTLRTFKLATERAKMEGVNVTAAERLIDEARKAMEDGQLKKALEFAMRSEGELEKVGLQQDMASKAIKTAEDKLEDSRSKGIYSKSAETMLSSAREMIKNGDYVKALEVAVQSGDELHKAREDYEEAMDALKKARDALAVTIKIGDAAPEVEGIINAASEAISRFEYSIAKEKASDAVTEAKRLSYSMASNLLVTAHNLVNTAARIGLRVTEAQTMITEAKSFLDNSRFESAHDAAKRAIDFDESA